MAKSLVRWLGHKARSKSRMWIWRSRKQAAPPQLPQRRAGALHELEAVTVSTEFVGWLNPQASLVTLHLLDLLPFGPVVEIGDFRGKYLSILRSGMGETCRIVGYDIFDEDQAPQVEDHFERAFGTVGNMVLIQIDSTLLTADRVLRDCGAAPVFMSIDGSHEAEPVLSDMRLADGVLEPAGIVAMDDVLNPLALGVNEALGRFLDVSDPGLVPFAYAANKLFLCRPDQHATYMQNTKDIMAGRGEDPSFAFYREHMARKENLRRSFYGWDVLILTG